jgi:hypothetical protein
VHVRRSVATLLAHVKCDAPSSEIVNRMDVLHSMILQESQQSELSLSRQCNYTLAEITRESTITVSQVFASEFLRRGMNI